MKTQNTFLTLALFITIVSFSQNNTFPTTGNVGIGTSYTPASLTILKSAPAESHIMFGNPSATAGQVSSKLTFAGLGIQHSGFAWIPGTTADNGKLNLSFGGGNDPAANSTKFTFQSNGNLGIGIDTPGAKFHVNNGDNSYGSILASSTGNPFTLYTKTLSVQPVDTESFRMGMKYDTDEKNGFISFYRGQSTSGGFLGFSTNGLERMRLDRFGNIGIGINIPTAKLHVNNGDNSYGSILATSTGNPFALYTKTLVVQPVDTESFRIGMKYDTDENNGFISFYRGQSGAGGFLGFSTFGLERMRIDKAGNVGIGTDTKSLDAKLCVRGQIHTQEVRIDLKDAMVPDYVFANDYKLKPLNEVDQYIKANSHLPEIPSATEMAKTGMLVSEMNLSLLKKIEELTLYAIEQQKKLEAQNKQIETLATRLSKLEK